MILDRCYEFMLYFYDIILEGFSYFHYLTYEELSVQVLRYVDRHLDCNLNYTTLNNTQRIKIAHIHNPLPPSQKSLSRQTGRASRGRACNEKSKSLQL